MAIVFPARRALHTVDHREEPSLPGIEVIGRMGIPGKPDAARAVLPNPRGDGPIQLFRAGEAQRPVHEIFLIIDDKQDVHIGIRPLPSFRLRRVCCNDFHYCTIKS
ncbi:hypothetical protein SDC9_167765 [bioreactor metagenome]|uniref:Uncharacterized protein n=1 Tax=bioreactor metagenome TaxID=1076179 RepID=A0A645G2K3_9ZZZZ